MSIEHIDLFEMIQSKIHSDKFKEKYRTHPKAFTRRRKLDFPTMIGSMLNRMSKVSVRATPYCPGTLQARPLA